MSLPVSCRGIAAGGENPTLNLTSFAALCQRGKVSSWHPQFPTQEGTRVSALYQYTALHTEVGAPLSGMPQSRPALGKRNRLCRNHQKMSSLHTRKLNISFYEAQVNLSIRGFQEVSIRYYYTQPKGQGASASAFELPHQKGAC